MATVAEMVAVLRADTTQFSAAIVKAEGEVKGLGATAGESSKIASKAFLVMGAAAVVGIGLAIDATVKFARETKTLQRITGDSALATSSLISSAATLGISSEKLGVSFGLLQKNISSNSKAWQLWGVDTTDAAGKALPFSAVLGELADKFVSLGGAGLQATAMMKALFGRGGTALMPLLAQGAAGIKQLTDEAIHMGAVLTDAQLATALGLSV